VIGSDGKVDGEALEKMRDSLKTVDDLLLEKGKETSREKRGYTSFFF
jgi:hypothetical protein